MPEATGLMAHNWGFAIFLLGVVGLCAFMLGVSSLLGSKSTGSQQKRTVRVGHATYRWRPLAALSQILSGRDALRDLRYQALFLFAWSVSVRESGWTGFVEALVFIAILLAGLVYLFRVGALDWAPEARRKRQAKLKQ